MPRSPFIAFLVGGFFLLFGAGALFASWPTSATDLEPWEGPGHRKNLESWDKVQQRRQNQQLSEEQEGDPRTPLFMGGVMVILGLGLMLPQLVAWLGESAFKEATLEPPKEGAALGGQAVVRVRLVPGGALRVASAELRLISEEVAYYLEEGTYHSSSEEERYLTRVFEVHRWSTRLAVPLELNAPFELEVPIPIPREVPPTFRWKRHLARTRLELEVVLLGRMNLNLERELIVLPRLASAQESV
ncbi:MAG TPA: hypothetical protein VK539_31335 [Myxococcaceae bacterium]|nr:hypothetical protein [Myxococcaceae bacterium]